MKMDFICILCVAYVLAKTCSVLSGFKFCTIGSIFCFYCSVCNRLNCVLKKYFFENEKTLHNTKNDHFKIQTSNMNLTSSKLVYLLE